MAIQEIHAPELRAKFVFNLETDTLGSGTVGEVFKVKIVKLANEPSVVSI